MGKISRLFISFLIILFFPGISFSGNPSFSLGARSAGMANASVTLSDAWAVYNNIGGLSGVEHLTLLLAYEQRYALNEMSYLGVGLILPAKFGNASISIDRFGGKLYNEHKIAVGFSHNLGMVSLGVKANYLQYHVDELGTKGTVVLEAGGVAELTPQIVFGAHIFNIHQAKLAEFNDERVPVILKAGLSYRPGDKFLINLETEKDVDFPPIMKAGIEYEFIQQLKLRLGISTSPSVNYFGIGFNPGKISADYAVTMHPELGLSHQLSVSYRLKEKK